MVFIVFAGLLQLPWRRSAALTVPFLLAAAFYVVWRHLVLGQSAQCAPLSGSYGKTLIDMFPVALEYWRLLWGIPPFCADYDFMVGMPPHPFLSGAVLGGVFLVLFFVALAAWLWRRPEWRMSAFGLVWLGLFLLPVSNLLPMMQYMAERFLYLPLMGFLLALGGVFLNFSRLRPRLAAADGGGADGHLDGHKPESDGNLAGRADLVYAHGVRASGDQTRLKIMRCRPSSACRR